MTRRTWRRFKRFLVPGSLRFQLLSRSLFILAGLLLLIGLFQYVFMQNFLYKNKAASLQSQIYSIPGELWQRFSTFPLKQRGDSLLFFPDSSVAFLNVQGEYTVLSRDNETGAVPKLPDEKYREAAEQAGKRKATYTLVKDDLGHEQLTVLQPIRVRGHLTGIVQIGTKTEPLDKVLIRQLLIFLSLSSFALIMGLLTFLPILRRTLVPLSRMVNTVEQINSGNLNERLPTHQGQMEIDQLSVSFNRMMERLETSFEAEKEAKEQMRRFVADASHELRTPLTSIHGFLEVLLRGASAQRDQLDKALRSMYGESKRINKLVHDLLLLARLDRRPATQWVEHSLGDMLREMEPQLRLLAGGREVVFRLETDRRSWFDPDKMKQVILNLFQNAIQHTDPEQGRIEVAVGAVSDGIELAVTDNGPGIPKEHLPHLFEPFYRVDSSRARKYGGAGLGLAIIQSIVGLHNGSIRVESHVGEGCVFRVRIPEHPEQADL